MATMNISLPDELRDLVNEQVAESSCTSPGDYRRQLIREHRELGEVSQAHRRGRQFADRRHLRQRLLRRPPRPRKTDHEG